jgi:hypothetical protein
MAWRVKVIEKDDVKAKCVAEMTGNASICAAQVVVLDASVTRYPRAVP